jgi:predicted NBD/HSP70 family sugar kinase
MLHVKHEFCDNDVVNKHSNIVIIVVGTGIGTALIIDGKHVKGYKIFHSVLMLSGAKGWAGCFGTAQFLVNSKEKKTLDELSGGRALLKNIAPMKPEQLAEALRKEASELTEQEKKAVDVAMEAANALGLKFQRHFLTSKELEFLCYWDC